jgi:hypothetical protein
MGKAQPGEGSDGDDRSPSDPRIRASHLRGWMYARAALLLVESVAQAQPHGAPIATAMRATIVLGDLAVIVPRRFR